MGKRRLNGTGSIFYREDRKRWIFEKLINGKVKCFSAVTQKELMRKVADFEDEEKQKKYNEKNVTLSEILNEINDTKYKLNKIKANSYKRRQETIKMLGDILDYPINKITEKSIFDLYTKLINKYSDSTISKIIFLLNEAFKYAVKKELVPNNIIQEIERPKSKKNKKEVRGLTIEEQKKFLSVIHHSKYFLIYLIAIHTGMRCGEILALQKSDIDLVNDVINVNKTITRDVTGRPVIGDTTKTRTGVRKVPILSAYLKEELEKYLNDLEEEYLFTNKGNLIYTSTITSEFKRLNKKYNISSYDVSIHMLRHTFATRCIEVGVPALVLAKVLGHSDISTTLNTYTDVFEEFQNKSLEKVKQIFSETYKTVK